jgi:hypothetical protein
VRYRTDMPVPLRHLCSRASRGERDQHLSYEVSDGLRNGRRKNRALRQDPYGNYVAEKGWVRLASNLGVTTGPTPLPELSSSVARVMLADLVDASVREKLPSSDRAIWQRPYAKR